MTKLRKHTSRGRLERQRRALERREDDLDRYEHGDFLDARGRSLVDRAGVNRNRKDHLLKERTRLKDLARQEIDILRNRVGPDPRP